jgi:hypothetical protein
MRLPFLLAAVVLVTAAVAPPAVAAEKGPRLDAITVGDSVQLGAKWVLLKRGVDIVDAKVSRQARTGPDLLRKRGEKLPKNVIIHLGTNGSYALEDCKDMVKIAGPDRRVFMMTISVPRKWEKVNNDTIRRCARAFPAGRVTIIDWKAATKAHPSWLYSDDIHLPPAGAKGYARLIVQAITAAE